MQAWNSFLKVLEQKFGEAIVKQWLLPLKVVHFDAGNLYLEAETSLQVEWFEQMVRPELRTGLFNNNYRPIKVHLTSRGALPSQKNKNLRPTISAQPIFSLIKDPLLPEYTLDKFAFTASNQMLQKLSTQILEQKEPLFNPIFLYANTCAGKTHLLQALAHAFIKTGLSALYTKAETFTENVVTAIRTGNMRDFRAAHRTVDVFLFDDVQYLGKKNATQEEFFHTFNALQAQGKQILLSSNTSPSELLHIEPRLISRFEWGLCLPIIPLEKEDLSLLVDRKSAEFGLQLSAPAKKLFLEKFPQISQILQALNALYLRLPKKNQEISPGDIKSSLADLIQKSHKEELTPEKIISRTAGFYGLTPHEILSRQQSQTHSIARQVAMYLCRHRLKMPFTKIGDLFERDHSTVMSGVKNAEENRREDLAQIQKKLEDPLE